MMPTNSEQLRFDGRVAVVTGAGAGLGREYALLLASRGAKVVVNDLGGTTKGEGQSQQAADIVVDEIRANGGIAVANYNSVVDGEKIIQTALDSFGRIDILVNNAGILRDRSFARISDKDWDLVNDVHLKGSFKCTQAAWATFKKQQYGRVIMTSSTSGLYGNFGQANYAAAKMGLVGLAKTVALEGAKNNIHCNIIVPTAASRMTQDVLPEIVFNELKPSLIAPVVAYLCHESNEDNGAIIISAAGWATKTYLVQGHGAVLRTSLHETVTPEFVNAAWSKVTDMSRSTLCENSAQALGNLMNVIDEMKLLADEQQQPKLAANEYQSEFVFGAKDLVLYALGVGATTAGSPNDLPFLYENHVDFAAIPSFFIMPGLMLQLTSPMLTTAITHCDVDLTKILHGEQYLEVFGPLPTSGRLQTRGKVIDVIDKRSGALVITQCDTYDEHGRLVVRNQSATFVVGAGNFGGKSTADAAVVATAAAPQNRKPDASVQLRTSVDQAALYRLSGDLNPLHIDPDFAVLGGQSQPILHGLCSLGFSVRAVLQAYAVGNASRFRAVKARFTKPVLPGQTLNVNMWTAGDRVHFETSVLETGVIVISGAYVDLHSAINANPTSNEKNMSLQSDAIFDQIKERVAADQAKAKSINAIFLYKITKNSIVVKDWTLDLKSGVVYEGSPKGVKADTTLTVADSDMVDIALGKTNPQVAFMKGKLKITGNIMLTQKLVPLLKTEAKL